MAVTFNLETSPQAHFTTKLHKQLYFLFEQIMNENQQAEMISSPHFTGPSKSKNKAKHNPYLYDIR